MAYLTESTFVKLHRILAIFTIALGFSNAVQATLLNGKLIGYQYYYPTIATPYGDVGSGFGMASNGSHLVGNGIEVENLADMTATLDISDTNLYVQFQYDSFFYASDFSGFRVFDVANSISDILSVSINSVTNMAGFDLSRVSFDANNIWVNLQGLSFNESTILSLDILGGQQEIPEPGTLALLGLALLGMVGALRRR